LIGTISISLNAWADRYTPDNPAPFTDGIQFRDCSEMQKYFNSLAWDVKDATFTGFEKQPKTDVQNWSNYQYITSELCFNGYRIEKPPLGTLVCYGYMKRRSDNRVGNKYLDNIYSWYTGDSRNSSKRDNCRYKRLETMHCYIDRLLNLELLLSLIIFGSSIIPVHSGMPVVF
jgi:hypothetical protein